MMSLPSSPHSRAMLSRAGRQIDEKLGAQKLVRGLLHTARKPRFGESSKQTKLLSLKELVAKLDKQEKEAAPIHSLKVEEVETADYVFMRQSRERYYAATVRGR